MDRTIFTKIYAICEYTITEGSKHTNWDNVMESLEELKSDVKKIDAGIFKALNTLILNIDYYKDKEVNTKYIQLPILVMDLYEKTKKTEAVMNTL